MINVRSLRALRAVVATGSVTQAAESLHITQPAVSRIISALEEEVGFAVFARHRGRLTITTQGEAFYREVERALSGLDEIAMIGRQIRNGGGTMLRVFSMSSAVNDILPRAQLAFQQRYPAVTTNLEIRGGREVTHWGPGRQFDLGIVMVPEGHTLGHMKPFVMVPAYVVMPQDHALATLKAVSLAELATQRLVMMPSTSIIRRWLDGEFDKIRVAPTVALETSSMMSAAQYAAKGVGLTIADPFAIHAISHRNFVVRPLEPALTFGFSFVLPTERPPTEIVKYFMSLVEKAAVELLAELQT
ncbi:MAG TPA: LysR family transcriptional regulator [Devosiaceae bacterium]|jgi:DNA-binding transcriptional LysR family regulator